ncbi:hypothetical protein [Winogradskya consettensis]|nr:hypothetical protein [Actinoplanes consettensis]
MRDRTHAGELLVTSDLQVSAAETMWRHVNAEYVDDIDEILATLAPSGPYAYTVSPAVEPGHEIPTQRIVATYDGIAETYRNMHRFSAVVAIRPMTELHGSWYSFVSGIGRGRAKATGAESQRPVIVLFPTMGSEGITGELFWGRTQSAAMPGDPADGPLAARYAVAALQTRLLDAFRTGDVDTIAAHAHPETQTGTRDYLTDAGTLVELHTRDELRAHLTAFYDHYSVRELALINQHVDDWFFFHELRWTIESPTGTVLRFHTAEYAEVSPTGLVVARIGHGTDPIPL